MKSTRTFVHRLVISVLGFLAITSGCADKKEPPPPPPNVTVVGFVPDYCFWDGYEYVGWVGNDYYYWGPSHVWVICDPIRVQRANVWIKAHPDWCSHVTPSVQPRVDTDTHPHVQRTPTGRHRNDHDD